MSLKQKIVEVPEGTSIMLAKNELMYLETSSYVLPLSDTSLSFKVLFGFIVFWLTIF